MKSQNKILASTLVVFALLALSFFLGRRSVPKNCEGLREGSPKFSQYKQNHLKSEARVVNAIDSRQTTASDHLRIPAQTDQNQASTSDRLRMKSKLNQAVNSTEETSTPPVESSAEDPYENPPVQSLQLGQNSPDSIFAPKKFSPEEIKEKFEASIARLELVNKVARVENLECTEESCTFEVSERLPEDARMQLYDYYESHPQYGKAIEAHPSKDDPNRIVYTLTDKDPQGVPWQKTSQ